MAKNNIIDLYFFDENIGKIGYDENQKKSFFQYSPIFLKSAKYSNIFPLIIKRTALVQVFSEYNNDTFRGLPPVIADSLPDVFGNTIFQTWLETNHKSKISVLEQLAYVGNRGMGALEYKPSKKILSNNTINIDKIVEVLTAVLNNKHQTIEAALDSKTLLNIFKIGTSAGGARPKILISEQKSTGKIIPGDLAYSDNYNHYLIKLHIDIDEGFNREKIEYCYYLTAKYLNINMMPSKLIDDKHFATIRFDRQNGQKKHILTATGITGWDFKNPEVSTYENLFDLTLFLKLNHSEREELFKRMVFNLMFCNTDDHLKNHSFLYDEIYNKWNLAPAYDLTYSLNPFLNYKRTARALAINGKRIDVELNDILSIAEKYSIKNPKIIIENTQKAIGYWQLKAKEMNIAENIINGIKKDFKLFV
jgi:serine/threonine-protein kinase HipA